MSYRVVITSDAQNDFDLFIEYLLFEKKNSQAALNLINDFEKTIVTLSDIAGSLKLCENEKLRKFGYRRIGFSSHRYFMIYRIKGDMVIVDSILHELQDYENKIL